MSSSSTIAPPPHQSTSQSDPLGRGRIEVLDPRGPGGGDIHWFIRRDGKDHGPLTPKEMAVLLTLGHLGKSDLVWRNDFKDWVSAWDIFPHLAVPDQTASGPVIATPPRGAEIVAFPDRVATQKITPNGETQAPFGAVSHAELRGGEDVHSAELAPIFLDLLTCLSADKIGGSRPSPEKPTEPATPSARSHSRVAAALIVAGAAACVGGGLFYVLKPAGLPMAGLERNVVTADAGSVSAARKETGNAVASGTPANLPAPTSVDQALGSELPRDGVVSAGALESAYPEIETRPSADTGRDGKEASVPPIQDAAAPASLAANEPRPAEPQPSAALTSVTTEERASDPVPVTPMTTAAAPAAVTAAEPPVPPVDADRPAADLAAVALPGFAAPPSPIPNGVFAARTRAACGAGPGFGVRVVVSGRTLSWQHAIVIAPEGAAVTHRWQATVDAAGRITGAAVGASETAARGKYTDGLGEISMSYPHCRGEAIPLDILSTRLQ